MFVMKCKLVILSEIIAPYRIPVFNALARHESIDLHVIFLAETDPTLRQWQIYKDEIQFRYQVLPSWRRRFGKHNVLLNRGVESALRKASPSAILCGGYNYVASWQSLFWARRHRVPFSLWVESTVRDFRAGSRLVESLKAKFMHRCDKFIVPGKAAFEYVISYGAPEESIFAAPNAVDDKFFAERAEAVRREAATHRRMLRLPSRFFLSVGRLVREKGVFDLLQAYGTIAPELRTEMGLVFVGDGEERPELEQRARAIEPGTVLFPGFAQREQLAGYYALAEMLVFPTHTDTWGLVVNEAMVCGLPIISTSVAGCAADLVEDRWNGRIVMPREIEQLASAMEELASNAEQRGSMGQHSRERILHYSPEECAAGIANAVLSAEAQFHD
jgi:glycosyltransferase involved in cell wall biosynthesis